MSLMHGFNPTTNKTSLLNIDDDGKLRLDESAKINSIYEATQYLKNFTISNDLRYLRGQGKIFICSAKTDMNTTDYVFSFLNPSNSSKKVFIYGLSGEISNNNNVAFTLDIDVDIISAHTINVNNMNIGNLKIGDANTSSATAYIKPASVTKVATAFSKRAKFSATTDYESIEFSDLFNESMELPAGYGLAFKSTITGTANAFGCSVYIKYIELDDTDNYPNVSL